MSLTKQDLSAIKGIVKAEVSPLNKRFNNLEKKVDRNFVYLKKRFDEFFNVLDRKYLEVKKDIRAIQGHLRLPVSDF